MGRSLVAAGSQAVAGSQTVAGSRFALGKALWKRYRGEL